MSILNSILKTFVGDKTKKDLKEITPLVNKINEYQKSFETLSHDMLREKTISFKSKLKEANQSFYKTIKHLQEKVNKTNNLDEKESI